MGLEKFLQVIRNSVVDLIKNPFLFIPGVVLWGFIFLFSKFSYTVNKSLTNMPSLILWLIVSSLITLTVFAFIFSGFIGVSKRIIEKQRKKQFSEFIRNSRRFFFSNLVIILIITIFGILIWAISFYGATFIGKVIGLEANSALILYILIYFIGIISFLIFFTFSSFFLILDNINVKNSIKKSFKFVKENYLETLSINVLIFVIIGLFNKINNSYVDILEYVLLVPLIILILTRLTLSEKKSDI